VAQSEGKTSRSGASLKIPELIDKVQGAAHFSALLAPSHGVIRKR